MSHLSKGGEVESGQHKGLIALVLHWSCIGPALVVGCSLIGLIGVGVGAPPLAQLAGQSLDNPGSHQHEATAGRVCHQGQCVSYPSHAVRQSQVHHIGPHSGPQKDKECDTMVCWLV